MELKPEQVRIPEVTVRVSERSLTDVRSLYKYVQPQMVGFFSRFGHRFWPFWSYIGYGFTTLVLNRVCPLEEATFSSLSIRPSDNKSPS